MTGLPTVNYHLKRYLFKLDW